MKTIQLLLWIGLLPTLSFGDTPIPSTPARISFTDTTSSIDELKKEADSILEELSIERSVELITNSEHAPQSRPIQTYVHFAWLRMPITLADTQVSAEVASLDTNTAKP